MVAEARVYAATRFAGPLGDFGGTPGANADRDSSSGIVAALSIATASRCRGRGVGRVEGSIDDREGARQ